MKLRRNWLLLLFCLLSCLIIVFCLFNKYNYKELFKNKKNIKLAIQTVFILKENLPFLEEWIQHHKQIGIDKFYLYDNTGSVGNYGSNNNKNKYNIQFNKLIKLNDSQLSKELSKILKKYPEVTYVKWQPKNEKNEIIYGQGESINHYIKKYGSQTDWTIFTDIDEFLYGDIIKSNNLKEFIKKQNKQNIFKIMIKQKKYADRFCNIGKSINQIDDMIVGVNTDGWAEKCIVKNNMISLLNKHHIHDITLKNYNNNSKKITSMDINELCFNHYNVNKKQIDWMKGFFKQDNFKSGKDTENKYNTDINNENMFDLQYYNQVKNDYCYNFNNIETFDNSNKKLTKIL